MPHNFVAITEFSCAVDVKAVSHSCTYATFVAACGHSQIAWLYTVPSCVKQLIKNSVQCK